MYSNIVSVVVKLKYIKPGYTVQNALNAVHKLQLVSRVGYTVYVSNMSTLVTIVFLQLSDSFIGHNANYWMPSFLFIQN